MNAVVIDAVRSPIGRGKAGGALSGLHPVELLGQVLTGLLARNGTVDPTDVDDVIVGCVSQAGEQSGCPGRLAWLGAGLPETVPATTIDRRCGSGQQAVHFAAQGIAAGAYDLVVAAGVESMSRVPMFSARAGGDPWGPSVTARYAPGLVPQGISAELVAARHAISRSDLDALALRSQQRAAAAARRGAFTAEIVPITVPAADGTVRTVSADETIRPGTTAEALAGLRPSFIDGTVRERFPEISWSVTAGNSSQFGDGAAAMLLASEDYAARHGLTPRARFEGFALAAGDPVLMLDAPIPATRKVLDRAGLRLTDIDHFEVNEAFASVPLAWQRALRVDAELVNPLGGAIALGHPLGASGVRLMTTMLYAMEAGGTRRGLQTMCEGSGMANATVITRDV
ncbi:thiolase family protein [Polymorphospora lycopeni]|uniref:Thiolase family protein n=1 Tax=Polymorphospora lycopeni TaxID=3140240 RepID=A0ABV5CMW5_9ACTN